VGRDSLVFLPELVLCGAIVVLLLLRLFKVFDRVHLGGLAGLAALTAMAVSLCQWKGFGFEQPLDRGAFGGPLSKDEFQRLQAFGGLLIYDHLTIFVRLFLYGFTVLIIWLTVQTGIPDKEDSADFYTLLLGAVVGMSLMASSNHLLMIYIGVEMASLPSYALAGFLKGRRQSGEAALKYVVYGGGASGIMLYGISLLAGKYGTAYLPDLALQLVQSMQPDGFGLDPAVLMGLVFVLIGIGFKLAAVPFHFWCPDVFEGASAEVAGFLSVASKGAALALLARVTLTFTGLDPLVAGVPATASWLVLVRYLMPILAFLAALTTTFGNLAAYRQTNLKRLLAYSTIAHAGYMMMGLAVLTRDGVGAMLFYLIAYLFMNLGAFAIVAFLRNTSGSEDLDDFRGLVRRSPVMVVTLCFSLLSLLGIPPLVGFIAKVNIFYALIRAADYYARPDVHEAVLSGIALALLLIAGVNTVFSAVYYLKVMKVMILEHRIEDVEGTEPKRLPEPERAVVFAGAITLVTLVLGVLFGPLLQASEHSVKRFKAAQDKVRPPVTSSRP